ncbi:hypothetical protein HMPREF0372_03558 [Flavonifractor plautii ATCC 29863]|uniref:Uncharacterized protein n=1 Tax=Flavonifractor plautii ATCC 29863 TaxID=411475 RepID=G9YVJ4_FLAPL|nr:hypothetical protein HMPREF0372_03558 [Flavonifractor plautii ATCC 29863]
MHVDALLLSIRCIQYIPIIGRILSKRRGAVSLRRFPPRPPPNLEASALYPPGQGRHGLRWAGIALGLTVASA